ncbi:MAG: hypothetical protein ACLFP1_04815 [Candidatus Goldiibacteriota bacterium]
MESKKEKMKRKWTNSEGNAVCCGAGPDIKASKKIFYVVGSYIPESSFEVKPVLSIKYFEDVHDVFAFYIFKAIPPFSEEIKGKSAEKTQVLIKQMEEFLDNETDPGENRMEEIRREMNSIFGHNRHNMPFIETWGRLNHIIRSDAVKERLLYKRVRLNNTVLKALIDVNKFDDNDEKHCRLAEKFLKNIG